MPQDSQILPSDWCDSDPSCKFKTPYNTSSDNKGM